MAPTLIVFAGRSRAGKGTAATIVAELAAAEGFTSFERQLSDNGKWHLARIFQTEISRVDAVAWFEGLKQQELVEIQLRVGETCKGENINMQEWFELWRQPLQKFIQHGLQEGGRDIFGEHFWTDMILPVYTSFVDSDTGETMWGWEDGFFDAESGLQAEDEQGETWTDLAIISDLRQSNEAERVHQCKGLVVWIDRPDVEDGYVTGKDHITERGIPASLIDYYLNSTGDLDYFREIVTKLFNDRILPRLKENA